MLGSRPENEYDVFYVDFGDREWISADRIVPAWKSILQLPLQAIECSLVNVAPLGKCTKDFYEKELSTTLSSPKCSVV